MTTTTLACINCNITNGIFANRLGGMPKCKWGKCRQQNVKANYLQL